MANANLQLPGEIWKDIVGYEGLYQISNLGRVLSTQCSKTKVLSNRVTKAGYECTTLKKGRQQKGHRVHRLVAQAFVPNPNGGDTVNHLNFQKRDNRAENLQWCTIKENTRHAHRNNRCERKRSQFKHRLKLSEFIKLLEQVKLGVPYFDLADQYKLPSDAIKVAVSIIHLDA